MYNRILVAIDGSATSDLALREAIGLAKEQNAMLRLVHVVDMAPPTYLTTETASAAITHFPLAEYQQALQEAGEKLLTTRATTAREAGVNVDTKLLTLGTLGERTYEAIEEQSREWPANLIVLGTEGRSGFQRLMIGSIAEGLVRISTKPVLLIRGTYEQLRPESSLVAAPVAPGPGPSVPSPQPPMMPRTTNDMVAPRTEKRPSALLLDEPGT
jgi:nucleotide-binding universal stress UspA family protein